MITPNAFIFSNNAQDKFAVIFGHESVKGFQYDLPAFLVEAMARRGPIHDNYCCPSTAPDRLVPRYLYDWWNAKDLASAATNVPKLTDIQRRAVLVHNTMVHHPYISVLQMQFDLVES